MLGTCFCLAKSSAPTGYSTGTEGVGQVFVQFHSVCCHVCGHDTSGTSVHWLQELTIARYLMTPSWRFNSKIVKNDVRKTSILRTYIYSKWHHRLTKSAVSTAEILFVCCLLQALRGGFDVHVKDAVMPKLFSISLSAISLLVKCNLLYDDRVRIHWNFECAWRKSFPCSINI